MSIFVKNKNRAALSSPARGEDAKPANSVLKGVHAIALQHVPRVFDVVAIGLR
jgi:hypothetical protein